MTKERPTDLIEAGRFDRAVILGALVDRMYEDAILRHGVAAKDRIGSPLEWLALLRMTPPSPKAN